MKTRINFHLISACAALGIGLASASCWSQSASSAPAPAPAPAPAANAMPASARLALPGAQHRWLDPLVGQWAVEMRVFVAPGQAPLVSKNMLATRSWILGGRYLREELSGIFAGNPSNRVAVLGFNNLDERWELSTIDTFEPGQMAYSGPVRGTPARFELHGESTEAGMGAAPTGRKRSLRFEFEVVNADTNVERIYVKYPAQPETLFVEQIFTRKP